MRIANLLLGSGNEAYQQTADYGLAEIGALVAMPVLGAGESAARLATSLGERFAVVQVWPSWSRWIDERMLHEAASRGRSTPPSPRTAPTSSCSPRAGNQVESCEVCAPIYVDAE